MLGASGHHGGGPCRQLSAKPLGSRKKRATPLEETRTIEDFHMRCRGLVFATVLLAVAASAKEPFVGYGPGADGCGSYLAQRRTPNKTYDDLLASWFYGFLSGHNYWAGPQVKGDVGQDTVLAYLDKYCRDAPLASVGAGAIELIKTYRVNRSDP